MGKTPVIEEPVAKPAEAAQEEPELDQAMRAQRSLQKFLALKGKIQLNLNIDELRGRSRR